MRWSWKRWSFNPSIHKYEIQNGLRSSARTVVYAYVILSIIIFASVFFLVYRGSGKAFKTGRGSVISQEITDTPCIKTGENVYECTSESIIEKAKEKPLIYVYQEEKEVQTSAYNSVENQTDSRPCEASDGTDICKEMERGIQTCATYLAPIGSTIYVPGWGDCIVHDRVNPVYFSRLDLYFGGADRVAEAKQWGVPWKKIVITYPATKPRIDN